MCPRSHLDQEAQEAREAHPVPATQPPTQPSWGRLLVVGDHRQDLAGVKTAAFSGQSASISSLPGRGARDMPGQWQRADSGAASGEQKNPSYPAAKRGDEAVQRPVAMAVSRQTTNRLRALAPLSTPWTHEKAELPLVP